MLQSRFDVHGSLEPQSIHMRGSVTSTRTGPLTCTAPRCNLGANERTGGEVEVEVVGRRGGGDRRLRSDSLRPKCEVECKNPALK